MWGAGKGGRHQGRELHLVGDAAFAEPPTLELRAPDSCTLVEDSLAIAALFRVLARRLFRDPKLNADLDSVGPRHCG